MSLPITFEKCPICYNKKTISREACANEPSIAPGTFVSLEKAATPIQDVNKIATLTAKVILVYYDVCAGCGLRYCTKAEIISVPTEALRQSGEVVRTLGR